MAIFHQGEGKSYFNKIKFYRRNHPLIVEVNMYAVIMLFLAENNFI